MSKSARLMGVTGLLLIAAALIVPYLNRTVMYDEAYTLINYAANPFLALFSYTQPNNHLLNSLMMWLVTAVMGNSPLILRFSAFAMGMLALAVAYRLGKRIRDEDTGLLALALLAAMFTFVRFSTEARGYTLTILLTLLWIETLIFAPPDLPGRTRYAFLTLSALPVMVMPSMLLLTAGVIVWLLWQTLHTYTLNQLVQRLLPIIVGTAIGMLFYLHAIVTGLIQQHARNFGEWDMRLLFWEWFGMTFSPAFIGMLMIFGLVAACAVVYRSKNRNWFILPVVIIAMTGFITLIQWHITGKGFFARNYIFLTAPIIIVAAAGLRRIARQWSYGLAIGVMLLSIVPVQRLHNYIPEIDVVINAIRHHTHPGDFVVTGCCAEVPAYYYLEIREPTGWLTATPDKQRVVIIPTPLDNFEVLYARANTEGLIRKECREDLWDTVTVYICDIVRD